MTIPDRESTAGIFPFPAFELFRKNDAVFSSVFAHCQSGTCEAERHDQRTG